jgi:hypothetical protein
VSVRSDWTGLVVQLDDAICPAGWLNGSAHSRVTRKPGARRRSSIARTLSTLPFTTVPLSTMSLSMIAVCTRFYLVPKLRLGTHPGAPGLRFATHHGKQSFRKTRDQAELGHEENAILEVTSIAFRSREKAASSFHCAKWDGDSREPFNRNELKSRAKSRNSPTKKSTGEKRSITVCDCAIPARPEYGGPDFGDLHSGPSLRVEDSRAESSVGPRAVRGVLRRIASFARSIASECESRSPASAGRTSLWRRKSLFFRRFSPRDRYTLP